MIGTTELKQKIKDVLYRYPRVYSAFERAFHFINFRSIARDKMQAQERQLRLYKYFEVVYDHEMEYLRQHCRELERGGGESLNTTRMHPYFPKVEIDSSASYIKPHPQPERSYIKHYATKNRWAGLSADQAFYLEASSLQRLLDIRSSNQLHHFPFPVLKGVSEEKLTVEMSHCGWSLDQLPRQGAPIKIKDHKLQVENIVNMLIKAKVLHLDLRSDGKNLCVDSKGNLSLIDFDIVVVNDERPLSWQIARRQSIMRRFPEGYYVWAFNKIHRALSKHSGRLELS
ncbi:MAG: hypothetical protein HLX50_17730 [Alteromonadaceae bacterium]|nr:hypothetical protein [Alteromonadaceae bacterium]